MIVLCKVKYIFENRLAKGNYPRAYKNMFKLTLQLANILLGEHRRMVFIVFVPIDFDQFCEMTVQSIHM